MCEQIMEAVCGVTLASVPALLEDFSRHPIRGQVYPGMVPARGGVVRGVLYHDVPPLALARLDIFEGAEYARMTVRVKRADGSPTEAETYVFRPEHAALLLPGEWDYERFLSEGRLRFQRQYVST